MAETCPVALIELRNAIKRELDDEQADSLKYLDMAAKFTHLKEPEKADVLRLIAGHEQLHRMVLESIVESIDRKCGSG